MTRSTRYVWIAGSLILLLALFVASHWDLRVSIRFVDRDAFWSSLVQRYGEWPAWLVVVMSLATLGVSKEKYPRLAPFRPLALAILALAVLHPLLITQGLKFFWGRIRFRDLGVGYCGYTPFYFPAGIGTGLSFPSGHVAMAFVLTPFFYSFQRSKNRLGSIISLSIILLYGLSVSWGRILAGAHYLTDCLFSAGLSFLLAYPCTRFGHRIMQPVEEKTEA